MGVTGQFWVKEKEFRWIHVTSEAVVLPRPARGAGTLIPSAQRLVWVTFTFHFHALEKEIATHSSVLAWRIPGMGEPGGLLSMGSYRVGHD